MPTQLKSDTARANGAKSQGPKTAAGRAKSSRNATRHGLSSRNPVVLECENTGDFQKVHDHQMAIHQPATPAEMDLVDQMIAARWRILRLQSIETDLLDTQLRRQRKIEKEYPSGSPAHLSTAYSYEADGGRAMALASRCEARLNRIYQSNYKILRELQAARLKQSIHPEPPPLAEKICRIEPKAAAAGGAGDSPAHEARSPHIRAPKSSSCYPESHGGQYP
jgi:hypothetical protein